MNDLKKIRLKNSYSCKDMAKVLHISKPYYWQIENGTRRVTYEMAIKIAKFFNTTPDQLFFEDTKLRIESNNEKKG